MHFHWNKTEDIINRGEVSLVNDDVHDNRFLESVGRFPDIEEDLEALHLLVNNYAKHI